MKRDVQVSTNHLPFHMLICQFACKNQAIFMQRERHADRERCNLLHQYVYKSQNRDGEVVEVKVKASAAESV